MAAAEKVLQEKGSCSMYQMFPRQQVGWGLQTAHGGLEVTEEEVWGKDLGFPGTGGEEAGLVPGISSSKTLIPQR